VRLLRESIFAASSSPLSHKRIVCLLFGCALLCSDLLVISGEAVRDNRGAVAGRQAAFYYYHTILNSPVVNGALFAVLLMMALGAWVGLDHARATRDPHLRRTWHLLVGLAVVGHAGYLFGVIPRYLRIRASPVFHAADFDLWERVLVARLALMASSFVGIAVCVRLVLTGAQQRARTRSKVERARAGGGAAARSGDTVKRGRSRTPKRKRHAS
jgi:hypothetical protein